MKAIIYLRVSTEQQAKNENSLPAQREACLSYAKRENHEVNEATDIYVDGGISGRTGNRDAFREMTERLKQDKGVSAVIVYDISRVFRNGKEYFIYKDELKRCGKKIISVTEPLGNNDSPADFMLEWMLAGFAEFRSRQDGEKIRRGMHHKVERGLYPGFAPFGYCNRREPVYGGKDKRWMETNPKEAPWVREMFSKYATGRYSLERLTDEMNARGIPTRNGKLMSYSTMEKMLKNEIYMGYIKWGGADNPNGEHEKLVEPEVFHKVQAIRETKNHGANRERKHRFLLRGIAYCGECNSRITGGHHRNRKGVVYVYYGCQKAQHGKAVPCGQSAIPFDDAERQFDELVKSIQVTEGGAEKIRTKIMAVLDKDKTSREALKKSTSERLENIHVKKRSVLDKYAEGKIDDDAYESYKTDLDQQELKCRAELARIEKSITSIVQIVETALGLIQNCYKAYKKATYDEKITLAQAFFARLTITDRKIVSAELNHPFVYICKSKASKNPVFQLQYGGGDGRS